MMHKSKRERLESLTKAWELVFGRVPETASEVANWAKMQGLHPVPRRSHPEKQHQTWDKRLAKVLERVRKEKDEASRSTAGPAAGQDEQGGRDEDCRPDDVVASASGTGPGPGEVYPDSGDPAGDPKEDGEDS